jgi:hypothetical protein
LDIEVPDSLSFNDVTINGDTAWFVGASSTETFVFAASFADPIRPSLTGYARLETISRALVFDETWAYAYGADGLAKYALPLPLNPLEPIEPAPTAEPTTEATPTAEEPVLTPTPVSTPAVDPLRSEIVLPRLER